jgi:tryptophanyl-tRNA synthetase
VNNLLEIYELLTGGSRPAIEAHFSGWGYGEFKHAVAEVVIEALRPIRQRYLELTSDPGELARILAAGAERAAAVAEPKLAEMKHKMGFLPSSK